MSRYTVITPWSTDTYDNEPFVWSDEDYNRHVVAVQTADIKDTKTGTTYRCGAYRVVTGLVDDGGSVVNVKPIKVGKGGTVPFYGETAWSDAARLFNDEMFAARRNAW